MTTDVFRVGGFVRPCRQTENSAAAITLAPCSCEWDPKNRSPSLVTKQPSLSKAPTPRSLHPNTLAHPSSTLESIDKQHKQQRGDEQGDATKLSKQQDFNTTIQMNAPWAARSTGSTLCIWRSDKYVHREGQNFFPSFHDFIWLQFQKFLLQSFETSSICSKMWICGASASRCVFSMCVCVRVGLRQNRAAEMRQALQIFVGWLTTPCRCQAPTAETTKRRIRLALEPQIPPPSLLLFSPSLFSLRGTAFTLVRVWLDLATFTLPSVSLSICLHFALIVWEDGGRNMAPEHSRRCTVGRLPRWCGVCLFWT